MTKSQEVATEIAGLLRARVPLLWVVTKEEARVERYLFEAAKSAGFVPRTWDCAQGVCNLAGKPDSLGSADPEEMLKVIDARASSNSANRSSVDRGVWVLRDFHKYLSDNPIFASVERRVRNLVRTLPGAPQDSAQAVIILTPSADVPAGLAGHATVIDWPMPDREEIARILDTAVSVQPEKYRAGALPDREGAIDAAVGLSGEEAENCFAKSLAQLRRIDPKAVAGEKKRVVSRGKGLEWYDPIPGGLDAVGGLDALKGWLVSRASAYTPEARAYGLPKPKGCILVGVPGCGKSLTSKAIATAWGVPLLRFDLGALKSKFVGESEGGLRNALKVAEAIGRCVIWIDEVEKAMQGATSGSADGGVSADALGTFLTWMEERTSEAFVIMTANDVEALPPELLRKGRFDEIWWVDLPTGSERGYILDAALRAHGRSSLEVGLIEVSSHCDKFTGSEVASLVPDALYRAFSDGQREITTDDLIAAAKTVKPLAKTASGKIEKLRKWQEEKGARPATTPDESYGLRAGGERVVDFS
jgi:hypothetical protein